MKNKKLMSNVSCLLAGVMVTSVVGSAPVSIIKAAAPGDQAVTTTPQIEGYDPYFREDPGLGAVAITLATPTNTWAGVKPLDYRVPVDYDGSTYSMVSYPFENPEGKAKLLQLNYKYNGVKTFGGISIQSPLNESVEVPTGATIEFDVYYPKSAEGKFMRWRIKTTSTDDSYLRGYEYKNLNPDWIGNYQNETWLKTHVSISITPGTVSNFLLELHGETGRPAEESMLFVGEIKIMAPDPEGIPLPDVANLVTGSVTTPIKSVYNRENGLFMVGAIGTGAVTGIRADHYEIFVNGNNLKADSTHPYGPSWLTDTTGQALSGADKTPGLGEYIFPTGDYQAVRDAGEDGEYKVHGHVLAWYNQAPKWMNQMIPAHLTAGYEGSVEFYGLGNNVSNTVAVDKEMAKRVQYNHIMYVMRHFLTTDEKYGSSESRGIIPFNSWDVLNEEIHESRHSQTIAEDVNSWRNCLKHTNWLVAMSDDDITGDIKDHYIYLLFKYAHIAAPNYKMAAAYKTNYASLPEYMKLDGHDNAGSIDDYVLKNPPKLTYNDYGTNSPSKARTIYNMVLELNTAWLSDPLYDGRPLIEDIGFQGHDSVGPTLASDNQYAMALFASLIDKGLLSGISYSELDLKLSTSAPGGGATAPAVLNVRQSDALGYQYALLYKSFRKFAKYIDHVISWGVNGSGWQGSYVLFDEKGMANAGYYGVMDPERFIEGHSYLDDYFAGEYEKVQDDYVIDLGDLGTYQPNNQSVTPNPTPTSAPSDNSPNVPVVVPTTVPTAAPTVAPTAVPTAAPEKSEIGVATEGNVPGVYDNETTYGVVFQEDNKKAVAVKSAVKDALESGKDVSYAFADESGKLTYSITMKADTYDSSNAVNNIKLTLDVNDAKAVNHEEGMLLNMKETKKFPAEAVLKVNAGEKFKSGDTVYLYTYDKATKKLECVPNNKVTVDKDGYVNLNINSGADYVILPSPAKASEKKGYLSQVTYPKKVQVKNGQSMENIFALPDFFKLVSTLKDFDATKNLASIGATVTYVSHNSDIVSIDKDGNIVANKKGSTRIAVTVTLSNGSKKKYVATVSVK